MCHLATLTVIIHPRSAERHSGKPSGRDSEGRGIKTRTRYSEMFRWRKHLTYCLGLMAKNHSKMGFDLLKIIVMIKQLHFSNSF